MQRAIQREETQSTVVFSQSIKLSSSNISRNLLLCERVLKSVR